MNTATVYHGKVKPCTKLWDIWAGGVVVVWGIHTEDTRRKIGGHSKTVIITNMLMLHVCVVKTQGFGFSRSYLIMLIELLQYKFVCLIWNNFTHILLYVFYRNVLLHIFHITFNLILLLLLNKQLDQFLWNLVCNLSLLYIWCFFFLPDKIKCNISFAIHWSGGYWTPPHLSLKLCLVNISQLVSTMLKCKSALLDKHLFTRVEKKTMKLTGEPQLSSADRQENSTQTNPHQQPSISAHTATEHYNHKLAWPDVFYS